MNLQSLIQELERQRPLKWDKKLGSSMLRMAMEGGKVGLAIEDDKLYSITRPCHAQIAERLEIPLKYYSRMETDAPELLMENLNTWLERNGKDFFVRGLGDSIRALLSDRYRVIDNLDFLYCSLNELQAHETKIEDCFLSETEMYVKVKSVRLRDFVKHRGDEIVGGLLFTNSETGHKALRIEPRIFRVMCSNGMVIEQLTSRQVHLGNGNGEGDDLVYLSIRRSIRELFGRFGEVVQVLRDSTEIKIRNIQLVINNLVDRYALSEGQKEHILMAFGAEPDYSQYGLANAITMAAQMEEKWEDSLELEKLGGKIVALPATELKSFDG